MRASAREAHLTAPDRGRLPDPTPTPPRTSGRPKPRPGGPRSGRTASAVPNIGSLPQRANCASDRGVTRNACPSSEAAVRSAGPLAIARAGEAGALLSAQRREVFDAGQMLGAWRKRGAAVLALGAWVKRAGAERAARFVAASHSPGISALAARSAARLSVVALARASTPIRGGGSGRRTRSSSPTAIMPARSTDA